jgi:hypothetical protein
MTFSHEWRYKVFSALFGQVNFFFHFLKQRDNSQALINYHLDTGKSSFDFRQRKFSSAFGPAVRLFHPPIQCVLGLSVRVGKAAAL